MSQYVELNEASIQKDVLTFGYDEEDRDLIEKRVLEIKVICRRKPREAGTVTTVPESTGKFLFFYALSLAQLQCKSHTDANGVQKRVWRYNRVILEVLNGNNAPQTLITAYTRWGCRPVKVWSKGKKADVEVRGNLLPLVNANPNVLGAVNYTPPGQPNHDPSLLNLVEPAVVNGHNTLQLIYRMYFMEYYLQDHDNMLTIRKVSSLFKLPNEFDDMKAKNRCVDRIQCR
jgi:hypothetical protein